MAARLPLRPLCLSDVPALTWALIPSQTVFGELIALEDNSDVTGLAVFILSRLLWNPDIAAEYRHPSVPHLYRDGKQFRLHRLLSVQPSVEVAVPRSSASETTYWGDSISGAHSPTFPRIPPVVPSAFLLSLPPSPPRPVACGGRTCLSFCCARGPGLGLGSLVCTRRRPG